MKTIYVFYSLTFKICFFVPQAILNVLDGLVSALTLGYCKGKIAQYREDDRRLWAKEQATKLAYFMIDWRNNEMNT